MSMILGSDYIDADNSFTTTLKTKGSKVFVRAFAGSGVSANTPALVTEMGSGYNATVLITALYGRVGVPEGTQAVGAGSWGWFQIRGPVEGVQASIGEASGEAGHAVVWTGATLYGSSSANQGRASIGQVGVFTGSRAADESTTINIYLTGVWATAV